MSNTWGDSQSSSSCKGEIVIPRQVAKFTAHEQKICLTTKWAELWGLSGWWIKGGGWWAT